MFTTIPSGAYANDYKKSGKYYIAQEITNLPTLEEPIRCILIVEEHSDYVTQTLYDVVYSHNRVFQRCCDNNTWSSWAEIFFNIPSFYKNYNNLSSLASAIGVQCQLYSWQHIPVGAYVPIDDNQLVVTFDVGSYQSGCKISFTDGGVWVKTKSAGQGTWSRLAYQE